MKREYIIIIGATLISLAVSIIILRAIEPRLFKLPADMQVVKLDRKIPPFYENVFRASDLKAKNFQLNDPVTVVRNKPLFPELPGLGPHDLLGFRNRYIPNHADVVTIGDSQTYGNNALMIESWPAVLEKNLAGRHAKVYSMAAGSWAAPQYLSMLRYAYAFTPQVIVIAFYTGNDALETFRTVYANDYWKSFRSDPKASLTDLPKIKLPLPDSEILRVKLDSNEIAFTPRRRLLSNNRSLIAVNTGFKIIERILTEIDKIAKVQSAKVFITVIPTKELVYADRVKASHIRDSDYLKLTEQERLNIASIRNKVATLPALKFIDLLKPLTMAAKNGKEIYPTDINGHPLPAGYRIIAETVAKAVKQYTAGLPDGKYKINLAGMGSWHYILKAGKLTLLMPNSNFNADDFRETTPEELLRYPVTARE